jgi:hypothetical protein
MRTSAHRWVGRGGVRAGVGGREGARGVVESTQVGGGQPLVLGGGGKADKRLWLGERGWGWRG